MFGHLKISQKYGFSKCHGHIFQLYSILSYKAIFTVEIECMVNIEFEIRVKLFLRFKMWANRKWQLNGAVKMDLIN